MDNICFIDCETTGTDYERHVPWEIGLVFESGEGYEWILELTNTEMQRADPNALRMNGFYDRIWPGYGTEDMWDPTHLKGRNVALYERDRFARYLVTLIGQRHLAANNISFDEQMVGNFLRRCGAVPIWSYHLIEVESYVAGSLGLGPPWRSKDLAEKQGIDLGKYQLHSALSDAHLARHMYDFANAR